MQIYAPDDELIADIPLSDNQIALLEKGAAITVQFHTPQMLRAALGSDSGAFGLTMTGDKVVATDTDAVKRCAALQTAIAKARGA